MQQRSRQLAAAYSSDSFQHNKGSSVLLALMVSAM
jgi:hypothetical protein